MADSPAPVLALGDRMVALAVRRSGRARRINLRIDAARAEVQLVLPRWAGLAQGLAFANRNAAWVRRELMRLPARVPFADGAAIPFLGGEIAIRHRPDRRGPAALAGAELEVSGDAAHLARRVRDWLKAEARRVMAPLAHGYADRLGRRITGIRLGDPQSRWGSCSGDGNLSLSWRLVLAPPEIVRYVVAHEVAHLDQLNHSPAFWRLVSMLVGDAGTPRAWLHHNGARLLRYG